MIKPVAFRKVESIYSAWKRFEADPEDTPKESIEINPPSHVAPIAQSFKSITVEEIIPDKIIHKQNLYPLGKVYKV